MPLRHAFTSSAPEGSDATKVRTSNWNADHSLVDDLDFPARATEPGAPSTGVRVYAREIVPGFTPLKTRRPSGVDCILQDHLITNRVAYWRGSNNAVVNVGAANLTFAGTAAAVTPASGSAKNQTQRVSYATTATAGNLTTAIVPNAGACPVLRGNVNGEGGFQFVLRFAFQTLVAGNRFFWGLAAQTTVATNVDPLTTVAPARVGLATASDTGNLRLVHSDGTNITAIDLGANFPVNTTDLYELFLFCRPHNGTAAGNIGYRVRRYTTTMHDPAFEATGTISTNQPGATTLLHPWGYMTNNATAAICGYHFVMAGIQSDF